MLQTIDTLNAMPDRRPIAMPMLNKRKVAQRRACRNAHAYMTKKIVANRVVMAALVICSCGAAPVATTSNGEPPPESEFDSWLFVVLFGSVTTVGTAPVGTAVRVDVANVAVDALGSTFMPEDDVLEGWTVLVAVAAVVVAGIDVRVLDCRVVRVVDEELERVVA
jgi:hypothetical protein